MTHHHYQEDSAKLAMEIERYMMVAKDENDIHCKLSYYLDTILLFNRINLKKLSDGWQEKIIIYKQSALTEIDRCYKIIHKNYQETSYPTYKKAYLATVLMLRTKTLLPNHYFKPFKKIIDYPKLIEVYDIKEALHPIIARFAQGHCFFPSKQRKGANIIRALTKADDYFQEEVLDLSEFLKYHEKDDSSLLAALQEGRICRSGPRVGSFRQFVKALNTLARGLGDSAYYILDDDLHDDKEMNHISFKN